MWKKKPHPPKPKRVFVWVFIKRRRELITTKGNDKMTLDSIPVGFQDIYEGVADEDVENPVIIPRSGDATQAVEKTKAKTIQLTVRGDGTIGNASAFAVKVDGHIGEGEAEIITEFDYTVISPDATSVSFTKVRREAIPTA